MIETNPDAEFTRYIERLMKREGDEIRKRYRLPLDDDALARAQADVERLNTRIATIRKEREDLIARTTHEIEATTNPTRKAALTELLDLYRRCPTAGEDQHMTADDALLDLIGDDLVRELFHAIPKWYA